MDSGEGYVELEYSPVLVDTILPQACQKTSGSRWGLVGVCA